MSSKNNNPNNLINEKSPYLLQHAYNPVKWHSWNSESLELAKSINKPIFLSIGYSTCYWCHVMERESFENQEISDLLNDTFLNIKVDREERPDIDRIYMSALQSITGSGGWPMSIFLTPDLKPFYAATYIPPKSKYGRAGFEDIIKQINTLWKTKQDEILLSADRILEILNSKTDIVSTEVNLFDENIYHNIFNISESLYDEENGGFGNGNKFPRPSIFKFLLDYYYYYKNEKALDMVSFSLKKMYEGGIFDNLDKGFHRYAVDTKWRVPHFEKMLYDQAQIISIFSNAYKITKVKDFLQAATETADYTLNFLHSENGGFYSAEDAESAIDTNKPNEKVEGYFYVWEKKEIERIIGKEDAEIFNFRFGILNQGNTLNDPHEIFGTKNVLFKSRDLYDTAAKFNKTAEEITSSIDKSLEKLKKERDKRPRPFLDKKIIAGWNGLIITALTELFSITNDTRYISTAEKTAEFILNTMLSAEGYLYHRYIDGELKYNGTLEDYAFVVQGLLNLYYAGYNIKYLQEAVRLTDNAVSEFTDDEKGGFFDSSKRNPDLVMRTKESYDGAEPSGNSVMTENLLLLSVITQRNDFKLRAEKSLAYFYGMISEQPFSSPYFLHSLMIYIKSPIEIFMTKSDENDILYKDLKEVINNKFLPAKVMALVNNEFAGKYSYINNIVNDFFVTKVYICEDYKCNLPVSDKESLINILKKA